MSHLSRFILIALLTVCSLCASAEEFKGIEPQPLTQALDAWARQTGLQVIYGTELTQGRQSHGAQAGMDPKEALVEILSGTGLEITWLNEHTASIRADTAPIRTSANERARQTLAMQQVAGISTAETPTKVSEDGNPKGIQEIIVTAQKRAERLTDVPMSISVLSGDKMDSSTVQSLNEALNRVPGVVAVEDLSLTQLMVRGVAAARARSTGASPVAYYLDSVPFGLVKNALVPDANPYDLDRVEVLRGPQGTLYGANALVGVVRVLTKDADVNRFEFKTRTSFSSVEDGGDGYRADAAVNIPIVEGKFAARAVAGYQKVGGWLDKPNDKEFNDGKAKTLRLKLRGQATDNFQVDGFVWLSRSDSGGPNFSPDGRTNPSVLGEPIDTDYDVYGASISYDFPAFAVSSSTSYIDFSTVSLTDYTAVGAPNQRLRGELDSRIFTQEVNINSSGTGPWRWSLGGMYRDAQDHVIFFRPAYILNNDKTDLSKSMAAFGELTRSFFDKKLELTGGLRYFSDDVSQIETSRLNAATPLGRDPGDTFDKVTPRAVITWKPRADLTAYASYSEGFRSGYLQDPLVVQTVPAFVPADPDTLKNYEVGIKHSLWDGRLDLETALYFMDWQHIQQSLTVFITPPGGYFAGVVNGQSASGKGVDFSMVARPVDGLDLGANFSWNDLAFDADVMSGGRAIIPAGARPNSSPKLTAGAFAGYSFPLSAKTRGRLSASANYTSKRSDVLLLVGGGVQITDGDSLLTANTSFAIESDDRWTATVFVDNVNNEDGIATRTLIPAWQTRTRPRTIGLQFEFHY